jgi:hypothetical protein
MRNIRELKTFETPILLSTTGSNFDMQLKDYTIKPPFASGAESQVYTVLEKKTGLAMIMKRLKSMNGEKLILREQGIASRLAGNHVCRPNNRNNM